MWKNKNIKPDRTPRLSEKLAKIHPNQTKFIAVFSIN